MKITKSILIALSILICNSTSFAQEETATIYQDTSIYSTYFKADKKIQIISHLTSKTPDESTPVLIVLDAYTLLQLTSAFTNHLISQAEISPMILIGLFPEDRIQEYTGKDAEKTVSFINNEVKALIKNLYPKSKSISIMGHSASADFLIEHGSHLNDITSISAMSPLILYKDWKNQLTTFIQKDIEYYVSSSTEDLKGRLAFVNYLDSLKLKNVHSEVFKNRNHGDNFIPGIEMYLKDHYRSYSWFSDDEIEMIALSTKKLEIIKEIKNRRDSSLNIDFTPNYMNLFTLSSIAGDSEYKQIYSWLLTLNLDALQKISVYMCLGDFYENQENYQEALNCYQSAYSDLPDWVTNKEDIHDNITRLNLTMEKAKQ